MEVFLFLLPTVYIGMAIVTKYVTKEPDKRGIRHWVAFSYNKGFVEKIKTIPSSHRAFDPASKMWGFTDRGWSLFCAISETQFLGDLLLPSEITYTPRKINNSLEPIDWSKFKVPGTIIEPELNLYDFQKLGISQIIRNKGQGLLFEPGLGKTYTAVCSALELLERKEVSQVLVISLVGGVVKQWARLLTRMGVAYTIIDNNTKMTDRPQAYANCSTPFVLTLYTSVLSTGKVNKAKKKKFTRVFEDKAKKASQMVIADELHKLGDVGSKTYKAFLAMAKRAKYRVPCTGTIIKSTPEKALSTLRFISPKTFSNKGVFEEAFLVEERGAFGPKTVGYKNLDRLKDLIHSYGSVALKKDHLKDLPELLPPEVIMVETSKDSLSILKSIRGDDTLKLVQKRSDVEYAQLQDLYIRIHQALTCPSIFSDGYLAKNSLEAVVSVLEEVEGKTIIFTTLIGAVREISTYLSKQGIRNVACCGGIEDKIIDSRVSEFTSDPDCKVMVATVQKMGTGYDDLKVAQNCIIYDFNMVAGDMGQAIDRLYRAGQKNKVSVFEILQDNVFSEYLREKIKVQENIIRQTEDLKYKTKDSVDLSGLIQLALESNLFGGKEA